MATLVEEPAFALSPVSGKPQILRYVSLRLPDYK